MKQLDNEYKKQIAIELPDLWDRIEAGVDAYEASKHDETATADTVADEIEKTVADDNIEATDNDNKVVDIKNVRRIRLITIGKIIAAAACIFLVINVFRMFGNRNFSFSNGNSAPTAEATDDYYYEASAAEEDVGSAECETEEVCESAEPVYEEELDDLQEEWAGESAALPTAEDVTIGEIIYDLERDEPIRDKAIAQSVTLEEKNIPAPSGELLEDIESYCECSEEEALYLYNIISQKGIENIDSIVKYPNEEDNIDGTIGNESYYVYTSDGSIYKVICYNESQPVIVRITRL